VRLGCAAVMAVCMLSGRAHAQANPAAETLFDSGREALAKGDYERACQQLRESNRLEPAVGTLFNLADCEEKRGKLATAWALFRAVEQKVPAGDERAAIARERAHALEPRLPKVTLKLADGAPKETTVRDGDTEIGAASLGVPIPMDPGTHEFAVSSPGRPSRLVHVRLAEGEQRTVEVQPKDTDANADAATRAQAPTPTATSDTASRGTDTKTLGFVLGGVGIAGLAVGAVAGVMVLGKKSTADENCPNKVCNQKGMDAVDEAVTLRTVSNVGWIVGALGVGAGAYFVLTSGGGAKTSVGAAPLPAGGRLCVTRIW